MLAHLLEQNLLRTLEKEDIDTCEEALSSRVWGSSPLVALRGVWQRPVEKAGVSFCRNTEKAWTPVKLSRYHCGLYRGGGPWLGFGRIGKSYAEKGSIPGWGRFPGVGNGNPLQCSCLGNPMDRGASQTTVCGAAKSWHDQAHVHEAEKTGRNSPAGGGRQGMFEEAPQGPPEGRVAWGDGVGVCEMTWVSRQSALSKPLPFTASIIYVTVIK